MKIRNALHLESALVTIRDNRRETTGWVSKCNRVLPERLVVNLKLGLVAIDCHLIGIAIDRYGDLLARVAHIPEPKTSLQSVAIDSVFAAYLERKQVSARDASRRRRWGRSECGSCCRGGSSRCSSGRRWCRSASSRRRWGWCHGRCRCRRAPAAGGSDTNVIQVKVSGRIEEYEMQVSVGSGYDIFKSK